ncbi:restriction endonuclease subunit S [Alteromonas sp. ASW11-19]|uniref:Restriction endonuclease subunit S n=1 Tax=Alteromonas salexigens TaxID=2982530 RepID=A0ABT2VSJ6_9ALTE|nr:restriction endonuclease subunit S [Alteromonas salexigens]MCU7555893.1 restriction endonuclease subunit S [Alteromonas salexigens]
MSWPLVAIGDFCKTGSGGTPSRRNTEFYNGDIPWIKSGDLREKVVEEASEFITQLGVKKSSAKLVPKGAILLAMYGATVGRMAMLGIDAATNQAVCSIIPDEHKAFPKYVYYALRSLVPDFLRNAVGGAQPNISQGMIKDTKIPLPPLDEQKRIAAILDNADAIRRKRQQAIQLADDFLKSVFLDMFGDPVTNPMGWESKKLGDICAVGSSKRVFVDDFVDSGIPFYRGTEVGKLGNSEKINPSLFISQEHYEALKAHGGVPKVGDLLLPSICPDGRIWQVSHNEPFYFKDGRVLWIKSSQTTINSDYLRSFLKRIFFANYSSIASGTTFAELKIVALKNLNILLPPANLQLKYSEIIEHAVGKISKQLDSSVKQIQLFDSLSQKAFAGEL